MKFRKKVLPLIIGITLAAGSLSGCGNNSAATESQITEAVTPAATEATEAAASDTKASETQSETAKDTETESQKETKETAQSEAAGITDASKLGIQYAKNFKIEYMDNDVKLVTDSEDRELLLVPKDGEVPAGYEDKILVRTPLEHAMYTSTTHVGYLAPLNNESVYDSIAAVTTDESQWTTQAILDRFKSGQIKFVNQDHWTSGDVEEITSIKPDMVFSGVGDQSGADLRAQLDEVGINYVCIGDYTEKSSEANMEWIKFFGAFYNLDQEASDAFNKIEQNIADLRDKVKDLKDEEKPKVAVGMIYDGVVYTQAGDSTTAKEIESAGGTYALSDLEGDGSVQLGMEEFVDKCKDADILIYSSMIQYAPDLKFVAELDPLMAEFKAYQDKQIYVYDNGYYMNNTAVDEKFEDLVSILHPEAVPDHQLKHYIKLGE